ncbi:thiamine-phosphate kinase [Legionella sp. W05-934-2]|jgi:thiamine-monophosphate kinase|uniref:thiamine-phosphate kinase n=1 Tax=Legionella sp. W05-934-2 TaxID=1198649 RepID=UPI0034635B4F
MDEFQLIRTFFQRQYADPQIICGSGDDAATLQPKPGYVLCVSSDSSVAGVHFLEKWDPSIIASKAVTANVSDIAAMAAEPKWVTVALTLPSVDKDWLSAFSKGLFRTLDADNIALVGGDITRGPLSINITIFGECLPEDATYRHGAKVGDIIYVTGSLGAPSLAVDWLNKTDVDEDVRQYLMSRLQKPHARTDCRQLISQFANSCIDVSDGLVGDLEHICHRSHVGANIISEQIPIDKMVKNQVPDQAMDYALHGGDEYQLCFTVAKEQKRAAELLAEKMGLSIYPIGHIIQEQEINLMVGGKKLPLQSRSYRHFT